MYYLKVVVNALMSYVSNGILKREFNSTIVKDKKYMTKLKERWLVINKR